jgi:hypothetical protein
MEARLRPRPQEGEAPVRRVGYALLAVPATLLFAAVFVYGIARALLAPVVIRVRP